MNNWQECRCQTDPTNALSLLRIISASRDGTNVTVNWQSVSGLSYYLEGWANLPTTSGRRLVATNIVGQLGRTSCIDTHAAALSSVFYRVGVGQ